MSFIIAGIILVGTLGFAALQLGAAMMSDSPNSDAGAGITPTLVIGLSLSGLVALSHWMPHIGW